MCDNHAFFVNTLQRRGEFKMMFNAYQKWRHYSRWLRPCEEGVYVHIFRRAV
ncbi:hypothetical protein ANAPC5_01186 [Anaplasma phagocytophilum]|nr:hypothetical protein ANAPC5_01186 [Anaplasma phagocytophilum]